MSVMNQQRLVCDRCTKAAEPVLVEEHDEDKARRAGQNAEGFVQVEAPLYVRRDLCKRCGDELQEFLAGKALSHVKVSPT